MKKRQTVLCSLKDEKGNLWFGNLDGSLTCYCKKERSFKILRLITEDGGLNKSSVWALFLDSKGRFWIGTHKGLWLFGFSGKSRVIHSVTGEMMELGGQEEVAGGKRSEKIPVVGKDQGLFPSLKKSFPSFSSTLNSLRIFFLKSFMNFS